MCNVDICDFVIWTECDLWEEICKRSSTFFKRAVLPELVGKYFSRLHPATLAAVDAPSTCKSTLVNDDEELFCVCQTPHDENAKYIGCDNGDCKLKWCHFQCMGINRVPKGKWYCTEYRMLPQFSSSKKRKTDSHEVNSDE